jgi:hypothetical protein
MKKMIAALALSLALPLAAFADDKAAPAAKPPEAAKPAEAPKAEKPAEAPKAEKPAEPAKAPVAKKGHKKGTPATDAKKDEGKK